MACSFMGPECHLSCVELRFHCRPPSVRIHSSCYTLQAGVLALFGAPLQLAPEQLATLLGSLPHLDAATVRQAADTWQQYLARLAGLSPAAEAQPPSAVLLPASACVSARQAGPAVAGKAGSIVEASGAGVTGAARKDAGDCPHVPAAGGQDVGAGGGESNCSMHAELLKYV